jgi:tetratricopeptide (TPR) repeat protein
MGAMRPYFFVIAVLLAAPNLDAQEQARTDSSATLKQAINLTREHRYAEADAALKGVATPANPAQKVAFYRLKAAIASGLKHYDSAAEDMELAAKLAPDDQGVRIAAGVARLQAQVESHVNPAETLKRLRKEVLPPAQAVDLRLRLAEILSNGNLFAEAATDFAAASALARERTDLLYDLALAHFRSGHLDDALQVAESAKAHQDSGSVESLLGEIQEKRGDSLAAVHSYQQAVTLEPGEEKHRLALALELLRHQTFDAALVVLNQSAPLFPQSVRIKILLGLTYYFVDRSADAIHALLEAASIDPRDETAARYLGQITLEDTSTPDAAATAQICKFADDHPANKTADAFCGGILLRLARDSGDDDRRAEILQRLQHAAKIAPKESVARCQLGKAYEWSEQWTQAKPELEACVRLDANSPDGHYQLSRVYRRLGLTRLAAQQVALQEAAAARQSEESNRRTETVTKFLVLLGQ